uniref:NADH:ubiquinone oxidoreductase intermediate-associated protein 30 domain-containing protein n=1 Tax=Timema shepardi TaxID=629360 RepID=A0A7R9B643_TIMSH|nr:unnamed protein product [Timema shepardi]
MLAVAVIIGLFLAVMFTVSTAGVADVDEQMLFDFTSRPSVDDWIEQSDTVRTVGMSKAVLVLQKTQVFQRAVFFALLNPQPNGAGFAGMRVLTALDLSPYSQIRLRVRAQGNSSSYKMVLRHKGEDDEPYPTYEQFFQQIIRCLSIERVPESRLESVMAAEAPLSHEVVFTGRTAQNILTFTEKLAQYRNVVTLRALNQLQDFGLIRVSCSAKVQLISTLSALLKMFGMRKPIKSQNQPSQINVHQGAFEDLSLPLSQFIPYYRGRPLNSSEPLDQSNITSLGLQVYGGVYLSTKQAGPSTLEMDWIKAIK